MRISDWSSDVCSSDLATPHPALPFPPRHRREHRQSYPQPQPPDADQRQRPDDNPSLSCRRTISVPAAICHPPHRQSLTWPVRQRFGRSEERTSELQSLMRTSYAVFCSNKTHTHPTKPTHPTTAPPHLNHLP